MGNLVSSEGATFVGVARLAPDVCDFVTPVFTTKNGIYVAQRVTNGRIAAFDPIEVGEELVALSPPLFMQVGDLPLYAVELEDGVCIGSINSVTKTLKSRTSGVARKL